MPCFICYINTLHCYYTNVVSVHVVLIIKPNEVSFYNQVLTRQGAMLAGDARCQRYATVTRNPATRGILSRSEHIRSYPIVYDQTLRFYKNGRYYLIRYDHTYDRQRLIISGSYTDRGHDTIHIRIVYGP